MGERGDGRRADDQVQHDVYGEILDCAYQWARGGRLIDPALWGRLRGLVEAAAVRWREPDHGIWEVRGPRRPFTYSVTLCAVALDCGARLAESLGAHADRDRWRRQADDVRAAVLEQAWDDEAGSLVEHLGGGRVERPRRWPGEGGPGKSRDG